MSRFIATANILLSVLAGSERTFFCHAFACRIAPYSFILPRASSPIDRRRMLQSVTTPHHRQGLSREGSATGINRRRQHFQLMLSGGEALVAGTGKTTTLEFELPNNIIL